MYDSLFYTIFFEQLRSILPPSIGSNPFSFLALLILNFSNVYLEKILCLMFMFNQVDIPIFAEVINEGNEIHLPRPSMNI